MLASLNIVHFSSNKPIQKLHSEEAIKAFKEKYEARRTRTIPPLLGKKKGLQSPCNLTKFLSSKIKVNFVDFIL